MKILSMTATFGKLDNETLHFDGGLNALCAPNEWGKSTWCAFLTAMLYGVDTRERTTKDQLAQKERYQPWSGKPMEGTLRILHQGRDITIQRRTQGRVPLGEFQAWETGTGVPIRELTADNCGVALLGVEKSVFLRTGFLRFSDLPMKPDEALRQRLNGLFTSGDESGSAELLGAKLRELKNRCRHNNTGLIPECQASIRQLQEQLWERQSLQKQHDAQAARVRELEGELAQLELHRDHLAWQEAQHDSKCIDEAVVTAQTAWQVYNSLARSHENLPPRDVLTARVRNSQQYIQEQEQYEDRANTTVIPIVVCAALGVLMLLAALMSARSGRLLPFLCLSIFFFILSAVFIDKRHNAVVWDNLEKYRRQRRRDDAVQSIQSSLEQLRVYAELETAEANANSAEEYLATLRSMARTAEKPAAPDPLTLSRDQTIRTIAERSHQLSRSRILLGQYRGRMEGLPDAGQLQSSLARERHRLRELEKTQKAIAYAQSALESAALELQRRYVPHIAQRAGEFLSRLTGGVYDRILVGEDLTIQAARSGETTLRSAQWRSDGTADQMYLALRLAVWELLSPECPIILDDALIRFDQERMEKAMELLKDLAKERQIILFSCQEREKKYLNR